MKYYIDKVNTWSPANRKCLEVQSFAKEFRQTLIPNEDAAEALVEELRQKVEELNETYPRTKRLKVRKEGNFVCCDNEEKRVDDQFCEVCGMPPRGCDNEEKRVDDQYVFTFHIEKVRQTYKTLEIMADEKGERG